MHMTHAEPTDRREYFRINDEISLRYRILAEKEFANVVASRREGQPDLISATSDMINLTISMKRSLDRCRLQFPELAGYLEGLNQKVDLLTKLLALESSGLPDHPTHDVNISGGGLCIRTAEPIAANTLLELKLLFFPSLVCLGAFGRVVRSTPREDQDSTAFDVAVDFVYINDDDRDLVVRHVLQRESKLLQSAREMTDDALTKDRSLRERTGESGLG